MNALRKDMDVKKVTLEDFEEAFKVVKGSITKEMMDYYKRFEELGKRLAKKDKRELEIQYL